MPAEEYEETEEEENETVQNIEESGNDVKDLEDEARLRCLFKRTEEQMRKWHRASRVVKRSDKPNIGVKLRRFREV